MLQLPWALHLSARDVPGWVVSVVTLHQTYFLTDIPLIYTFLVLAAIPVLALLTHGYARLVLAASWALWALWQMHPAAVELPWHIEGNDLFFVPAWQVLFVTALVIGFYRQQLVVRLQALPLGSTAVVASVLVGALVMAYFAAPGGYHAGGATSGLVFAKEDVGPGRIVAFAIVATFAYTVLTVAWLPARRALGWLLLPLGYHALTAYALHIFLEALATRGVRAWYGDVQPGALVTTAVQLAGVAATWAVILAWPALAGLVDTCRHCHLLHVHGTTRSWPVRLEALFKGGGGIDGNAPRVAADPRVSSDGAGGLPARAVVDRA
jgi:hypothetical protein